MDAKHLSPQNKYHGSKHASFNTSHHTMKTNTIILRDTRSHLYYDKNLGGFSQIDPDLATELENETQAAFIRAHFQNPEFIESVSPLELANDAMRAGDDHFDPESDNDGWFPDYEPGCYKLHPRVIPEETEYERCNRIVTEKFKDMATKSAARKAAWNPLDFLTPVGSRRGAPHFMGDTSGCHI